MDHFLFLNYLPDRFQQELLRYFSASLLVPPPLDELVRVIHSFPWEKVRGEKNSIETCFTMAKRTLKLCQKEKISFALIWSNAYPPKLKESDHPPLILFYRGNLPCPATPTLSIVGTRQPDQYGIEVTAKTLSQLQTRPLQIVSGLAYGIDSVAHLVSNEMKIPNFAVLGNGLCSIYPESHGDLAKKILDSGGGLLSEFSPELGARSFHFPRRNRIISALCDVLWVVQGTFKSGTRHTIEYACKQGKTVAATPGEVFNSLSEVPNRLILEGAHCILSSIDLQLLLKNKQNK